MMKIDKFIKSGIVGGIGLVMASKNAMAITAAHVATLGGHHLNHVTETTQQVVNVENLSAFGQFVHNNPGVSIIGFLAISGLAIGGVVYAALKSIEEDTNKNYNAKYHQNEIEEKTTISDKIKGIRNKLFNNIEETAKLKI